MRTVFTIGHSNHDWIRFLDLLRLHHIEVVCDVRSSPYSTRYPHYSKESLRRSLEQSGIRYVFLGDGLGARPTDNTCYVDGRAQYRRIAATEEFRSALDRVVKGAATYRVALLCSEKDPLRCHRAVLVCRHLSSRGLECVHVLADGSLENHEAFEKRMACAAGVAPLPLLEGQESWREAIQTAYEKTAARIEYVRTEEDVK